MVAGTILLTREMFESLDGKGWFKHTDQDGGNCWLLVQKIQKKREEYEGDTEYRVNVLYQSGEGPTPEPDDFAEDLSIEDLEEVDLDDLFFR